MMKKSIYLILSFLIFNVAFAQNSKEELYKILKDKYGNIESISSEFSLKNNPKIKGKLLAKKNNRYQMLMDNRIITCNGKSVWNYSMKQNNVVVSNFDDMGSDASVEKLFFTFANEYVPVSLNKEMSTENSKSFVLKLQKKSKENSELSSITLWVSPKDYSISSLGIDKGGDLEIWILKNLKINKQISDSTFEFKIPKDAEEIDIR